MGRESDRVGDHLLKEVVKKEPVVVVDKPAYRTVKYEDDDGSVYYVEFPKEDKKKTKPARKPLANPRRVG